MKTTVLSLTHWINLIPFHARKRISRLHSKSWQKEGKGQPDEVGRKGSILHTIPHS
ncbi:hypothetical protein BofuT4_uP156650.1 [Botrytis cinerea T4]|uniref:Uncharacterized protein n=1 Tax=Botryotinia fuckeliana (strain T4) TaxID=999810 RepID=G2YUH1_BOTF4|nr:hypothetical protein BofuT4_uP156650.1 [Botrytis cinerea T4]